MDIYKWVVVAEEVGATLNKIYSVYIRKNRHFYRPQLAQRVRHWCGYLIYYYRHTEIVWSAQGSGRQIFFLQEPIRAG